jgi:fructose-1,6-bisphosphatase I
MKTLGEFILENQQAEKFTTGELSRLINAIRLAAKAVNFKVNQAGLLDIHNTANAHNTSGEQQKKLDVLAHDTFLEALINRKIICGIASEESHSFIPVNSADGKNKNKYIVIIDPLDGSSNIDVNTTIGTIFSIYKRKSIKGQGVTLTDFLQPGRQQIAAGYIIYGTSTMLVYSTGQGVNGFTLNPSLGTFYLSHPKMKFPKQGTIISVNESFFPQFKKGIQDFLISTRTRSSNTFSSRYIGSFVADFHRNLIKGGIFLYPSTLEHPQGKLRLLYECNPIAFIAEQAGGAATNGRKPILDLTPKRLHQTTPLFCGNKNLVTSLLTCLNNS